MFPCLVGRGHRAPTQRSWFVLVVIVWGKKISVSLCTGVADGWSGGGARPTSVIPRRDEAKVAQGSVVLEPTCVSTD